MFRFFVAQPRKHRSYWLTNAVQQVIQETTGTSAVERADDVDAARATLAVMRTILAFVSIWQHEMQVRENSYI